MPRSALLVLVWLAVTAAAVGVAWAGVQIVATRVVEPLPPEALALASGDTASPADAATTAPGAPTTAPPAVPPSPDADPLPEPTGAPTSEPVPAATPVAELRSYRVVGGSVTLRFAPGRVTVVAAVPSDDDFDLELSGNGTARATVEFASDDHRSRVRGWWDDGPVDRVEEDDRSDDGDDRDDEGGGDESDDSDDPDDGDG